MLFLMAVVLLLAYTHTGLVAFMWRNHMRELRTRGCTPTEHLPHCISVFALRCRFSIQLVALMFVLCIRIFLFFITLHVSPSSLGQAHPSLGHLQGRGLARRSACGHLRAAGVTKGRLLQLGGIWFFSNVCSWAPMCVEATSRALCGLLHCVVVFALMFSWGGRNSAEVSLFFWIWNWFLLFWTRHAKQPEELCLYLQRQQVPYQRLKRARHASNETKQQSLLLFGWTPQNC